MLEFASNRIPTVKQCSSILLAKPYISMNSVQQQYTQHPSVQVCQEFNLQNTGSKNTVGFYNFVICNFWLDFVQHEHIELTTTGTNVTTK